VNEVEPTLTHILVGDNAAAWRAAGFEVVDDTMAIGSVALVLQGSEAERGILGWSFDGWNTAIDGLAIRERTAAGTGGSTHPNGVLAIDHVVIATPDVDRTIGAFTSAGFRLRREGRTESYGAPMRQAFCKAGDVILEIVGPEDGTGDGPATFFGLAFTVADLDAACALLGDRIGAAKNAVQPGRRIATPRHQQLDVSLPILFMSPSKGRTP
jgi:catechol 2,3-dioxygenase-like lactoylglutathione lyase family enzyme